MTTIPESSRKARATGALVLCVTAAAGALAGVVLDRAVMLPRAGVGWMPMLPARALDPSGAADIRRRISAQLASELQLTVSQKTRLDSVLGRQFVRVDSVMRRDRPLIDSLITAGQLEMDAMLTPEQRTKLAALRARMRPPLP
jgi:Spy/CpxP family protein refolding chaperone